MTIDFYKKFNEKSITLTPINNIVEVYEGRKLLLRLDLKANTTEMFCPPGYILSVITLLKAMLNLIDIVNFKKLANNANTENDESKNP